MDDDLFLFLESDFLVELFAFYYLGSEGFLILFDPLFLFPDIPEYCLKNSSSGLDTRIPLTFSYLKKSNDSQNPIGTILITTPQTSERAPMHMQVKCYSTVKGEHFTANPPNSVKAI